MAGQEAAGIAAGGRETLVAWLRGAHAMEVQSIDMMEAHARRLAGDPELRDGFLRHAAETREQARRVERALLALGADVSAIRAGLAQAGGLMRALLDPLASEDPARNAIGEYAYEHMEIAAYRCLVAAAEALGEPEVGRACEENLREELAMAAWLEARLVPVALRRLGRLPERHLGRSDAPA
jgi:ferritin-like metal-binding protein YciE